MSDICHLLLKERLYVICHQPLLGVWTPWIGWCHAMAYRQMKKINNNIKCITMVLVWVLPWFEANSQLVGNKTW